MSHTDCMMSIWMTCRYGLSGWLRCIYGEGGRLPCFRATSWLGSLQSWVSIYFNLDLISHERLTHISLGSRVYTRHLHVWWVMSPKKGWGAPCQGGGHLPIHTNANSSLLKGFALQACCNMDLIGLWWRIRICLLCHWLSSKPIRINGLALRVLYKERLLELSWNGSFVVNLHCRIL